MANATQRLNIDAVRLERELLPCEKLKNIIIKILFFIRQMVLNEGKLIRRFSTKGALFILMARAGLIGVDFFKTKLETAFPP